MQTKKSYKQTCPSCGAGVLVKDVKLVGKKIDCTECKFRFVVEPPKEEKSAADPKDKGKKKKDSKDAKPAANGKPDKEKPDSAESGEEGGKKGKKKKKGAKLTLQLGSSKQKLGLALGAVGLVVLAVAAYLIMNSGTPPAPPPSNGGVVKVDAPPVKVEEPKKEPEKEPEMKETPPMPPVVIKTPELGVANASMTNLLPNDVEHVARVFLRNALNGVAGVAIKEAYPLTDADEDFRKRIGIPLTAIDTVLRADRYSAPAWSYAVVHATIPIEESALVKALGLKTETPIKMRKYYSVASRSPWIDQLGRLAVGPEGERSLQPRQPDRPLYVHIYDEQTVIFSDKAPLEALLEGEGRFKYYNEGKDSFGVRFGDTTYLTIKPELKGIMDRMEKDAGETILFNSATAMDAARITLANNRTIWQFRQLWDIGQLLELNRAKVKLLGTGVYQNDSRQYLLKNEIGCLDDLDAEQVEKELESRAVPQLAGFLEKTLGKKVKVPELKKENDPMPMPVPVPPEEPKEEAKPSEIKVTRDDATVQFQLELALDEKDYGRFYSAAALLLYGMRSELRLAMRLIERDRLGKAVAELGEKGLSVRQVEPGRFPPGAFKRPPSTLRTTNQPNQRVSWMAGLLPFLGHESLYRRIDFNSSWQDPANLLAARMIVPEFLDPSYPDDSFTVTHPNLNYRVGGTHYVGIAGVGYDAPGYGDDPAQQANRGVFGYERSLSLQEVRDGRGLSNTILMIQVPYDGAAGVTPWIAGGGATLRGVPHKNSIEPFVLGRDRDGKPMVHNGKRGTFAVMTDGSVRFIDQAIADDVFKAMCTVKGAQPPNFDLGQQVNAPVVTPAPKSAQPAAKTPEKKL